MRTGRFYKTKCQGLPTFPLTQSALRVGRVAHPFSPDPIAAGALPFA